MNVLAIGAHPDDIEIGCGGTLIRHVGRCDEVTFLVATDGMLGPGSTQQRREEQDKAARVIGARTLIWGDLPDCRVDNYRLDLVHVIEDAISSHSIDRIYTHFVFDSHQDHEAVAKSTFGAARHCSQILQYGAPSAFNFNPTLFVDISEDLEAKVAAVSCHASQVMASEMVDTNRVRANATSTGHMARLSLAEGFVPYRLALDI
jgi:LmbE family N-acetylglucosaminyl deacetylase